MKCKDASLSLKDLTGGKELEVTPAANTSYPSLPNRTQDCELSMVGKPVYHNYQNFKHGAWLRDPIQKDAKDKEKIWLTKEDDLYNLLEYNNRNDLRNKVQPKKYKLRCAFKVF